MLRGFANKTLSTTSTILRRRQHDGGLLCTRRRNVSFSVVNRPASHRFGASVARVPTTPIRVGGLGLLVLSTSTVYYMTNFHPASQCEALVVAQDSDRVVELSNNNPQDELSILDHNQSLASRIKRALRMIRRLIKLVVVFTPVAALYPLYWMLLQGYSTETTKKDTKENRYDDRGRLITDAQELVLQSLEQDNAIPEGPSGWYYRLLLNAVELSGAALIKIMQWAGSRPDMFGNEFCAVFSQLQDDTTPHAWKYTERALQEAYGENWQEHVELGEILGSGCIAQVYKGNIMDENGAKRSVAVKVMHPNVQDDIDADLDILRVTVRLLEHINFGPIKDMRWINLPGFIEEMAAMLKIQLDLRTEGDHLVQFNKNFEKNETIVFPKVVKGYPPAKNLLIETYCEGIPIMDFIKKNTGNRELLSSMCAVAVKAVCQMIFLDNFTHGDLHPGNVLVNTDNQFVLLDVGMVTQHSPSDHRLISQILAAFIRCDGRRAGMLMVEDSDSRLANAGDHSVDEEGFLEIMEGITKKASGKDYLMQHLGTYITRICDAASTHHVMLNQAFISAALAVKVQEGIALAMDPAVEIWRVAIPIILEGERRYRTKQGKEMFGVEQILDWISGGKLSEHKAMKERQKRSAEYGLDKDPKTSTSTTAIVSN